MAVTRVSPFIRRLFFLIIFFAFGVRIFRLGTPPQYYFDEVYHAVTAKLILHNDPRAYEWWNPPPEPNTAVDWLHPPLAKLTQAGSMAVFGENGFGWRFSSAVFGTATIALVFFLALEMGFPPATALLAMALLSLDGLTLTTSRIAMNDAHVSFFFLAAVWLYARWKKQPTSIRAFLLAVTTGLAAASKWSGVFILGVIGLDQFHGLLFHWKEFGKNIYRLIFLLIALTILVPSVYVLSYGQMFSQGKTWKHFRELHRQTWWYQTNLEATHPYQSTPLEWVLNLRPVYVHASYDQPGVLQNIYMQGNPLIFWTGIVAVFWTVADVFSSHWKKGRTRPKEQPENLLLILTAYAVTWVPWLASPRIMFFYHYLPAVPLLCLLLAYQLSVVAKTSRWGKWFVIAFVAAAALVFAAFFPNWTALPIPQAWGRLYFLFPQWR